MSSTPALQRPDARLAPGGEPIARLPQHCHAGVTECLLERLPQAVILVDTRGAVGGMNERATGIIAQGDGLLIYHGVLRCRNPEDTGALHRLVGDVGRRATSHAAESGHGLRIRRPVGRRPLTALITTLRGKNALRNGGVVVAVLVNDPEETPALDVQMLRAWYDLTPAEARLAALLASGLSLEGIVDRLGIGTNTARTHLKNIFSKTDTRRQGELIRLLLSNPTLGSERADDGSVTSTLRTNRMSESSPNPGQARAV
jgi:DNA-binding CsgD family transcriptional regulator